MFAMAKRASAMIERFWKSADAVRSTGSGPLENLATRAPKFRKTTMDIVAGLLTTKAEEERKRRLWWAQDASAGVARRKARRTGAAPRLDIPTVRAGSAACAASVAAPRA